MFNSTKWNSLKNNVVRVWNSSGRKAYFSSYFSRNKGSRTWESVRCTLMGLHHKWHRFSSVRDKKQAAAHVSVKPPAGLWWWYRKPTKIDLSSPYVAGKMRRNQHKKGWRKLDWQDKENLGILLCLLHGLILKDHFFWEACHGHLIWKS